MTQNNILFSITELSNLTGKTRPTLYKYLNSYGKGELDDVPYSFIKLFDLMNKDNVKKKEIIEYCNNNFINVDKDDGITRLFKLIKENKDRIDIERIMKFIEEEFIHGGSN